MDLNAFLIGAGSAATLILAVVGVLRFRRSRSVLVVDVHKYPFDLPSSLGGSLRDLGRFAIPSVQTPPDAARLREEFPAVVEKVQEAYRAAGFETMGTLTQFWKLILTNRGHERAEGVEVRIPGAREHAVRRRDDLWAPAPGDKVLVGEIRPGESVDIEAWGTYPLLYDNEDVAVYQTKGRAAVRAYQMVGPEWAAAADFWKHGGLAGLLVLLSLVWLGVVLISKIRSSEPPSQPPAVASDTTG